MSREPVDIETLLSHRPFVRALARRLVRDEARAEDVVQETWLAALRRPPRHAGALRASGFRLCTALKSNALATLPRVFFR